MPKNRKQQRTNDYYDYDDEEFIPTPRRRVKSGVYDKKNMQAERRAKALDEQMILKSVSSINKVLIDAERQVKLVCEDLRDMGYINSATGSDGDGDKWTEDAREVAVAAMAYIQKASQLMAIAKSISMGEN